MADPRLFKITYDTGLVKYGPRRVLGSVIAQLSTDSPWYKKPVKIEAIPNDVQWDDVTSEFIKESE